MLKLVRCTVRVEHLGTVVDRLVGMTCGMTVWERTDSSPEVARKGVYRGYRFQIALQRAVVEIVTDQNRGRFPFWLLDLFLASGFWLPSHVPNWLLLSSTLRDHRYLEVPGEAQHLRDDTGDGQELPASGSRSGKKDLRDLMPAGEIHERQSRIGSLEYARFNVKIPREIEVAFHSLTFLRREVRHAAGRTCVDREALRSQVVRDSSPTANEHGG